MIAKFLLTLSAIIGTIVFVAIVSWFLFDREIRSDLSRLAGDARNPDIVITDDMLASLPEPAQRFFRRANIVGKPVPRTVFVTQTGRIRNNPESGWLNFVAEETYSTDPPGFVWRVWFSSKTLPLVMGRDLYLRGNSSILMKFLSLIPIASDFRPELGEAGLTRYLNEMMWFPAAYFAPGMTISPDTDNSFRVTLTSYGLTASAIILIDEQGRMVGFRSERFNSDTNRKETWETPMTEYATFEDIKMPTSGSAVWKLADSDFSYIELTVTDVRYND